MASVYPVQRGLPPGGPQAFKGPPGYGVPAYKIPAPGNTVPRFPVPANRNGRGGGGGFYGNRFWRKASYLGFGLTAYEIWRASQTKIVWNNGGWTKVSECGSLPVNYIQSGSVTFCPAPSFITYPNTFPAIPAQTVPASWLSYSEQYIIPHPTLTGLGVQTHLRSFTRPVGNVQRPGPQIDPAPRPWYPPQFIPPGDPVPVAKTPLKMPDWPTPEGSKSGQPAAQPQRAPAPAGNRTPAQTNVSRPGRRVRERKGRLRRGLAAVVNIAFIATEVIDAVDSIYDALPKKLRSDLRRDRILSGERIGNLPPHEKAAAIWEYWDQIDIGQAILNLAQNQIEDYFVGRLTGGADQFLRTIGNTGGGLALGGPYLGK